MASFAPRVPAPTTSTTKTPRATRAAVQRNRDKVEDLQRSMGNQAVKRLMETSVQRHPDGTAHLPGAAKLQEPSWQILSDHQPQPGEALDQYVTRLLQAHTVTDVVGGKTQQEFLTEQASGYYSHLFSASVAEKKRTAETNRIATKEKNAERSSLREQQQQQKAELERKKKQEGQVARQSKKKEEVAKEKKKGEDVEAARNQQRQLIERLTAVKDRPWVNKGMSLITRQGMSATGQKDVLSALDKIMAKLTPKIAEIGRTGGEWRTKDEFVKVPKHEAPGTLNSHIRVDLEAAATIDGVKFYGKIRIQGNDSQTWGGLFFQFNKAALNEADFRSAIEASLSKVGAYACVYDEADNPPLPGPA